MSASTTALRYFLRENDILAPVYAVDFEANTYAMVASRIGIVPVGGPMGDRAVEFLTDAFAEVWPVGTDPDGVVTYSREKPPPSAAPEPPA